MKRRPAFVVSRKLFYDHTGFVLVAPITNKPRGMKLEVSLEGTQTQGSVLIHQLKSLDYRSLEMERIEQAPIEILKEVTSVLSG